VAAMEEIIQDVLDGKHTMMMGEAESARSYLRRRISDSRTLAQTGLQLLRHRANARLKSRDREPGAGTPLPRTQSSEAFG
jgi:hypothetical protein